MNRRLNTSRIIRSILSTLLWIAGIALLYVILFGGFDLSLGPISIRVHRIWNPILTVLLLGLARSVLEKNLKKADQKSSKNRVIPKWNAFIDKLERNRIVCLFVVPLVFCGLGAFSIGKYQFTQQEWYVGYSASYFFFTLTVIAGYFILKEIKGLKVAIAVLTVFTFLYVFPMERVRYFLEQNVLPENNQQKEASIERTK